MRFATLSDFYLLAVMVWIEGLALFQSPRLNQWAARAISFIAYQLSRKKRHLLETNLQRAYANTMTRSEIDPLTRQVFFEFWDEMFCWAYRDVNALVARAQIVGLEHLRDALARGRGVILWESGGFGKRVVAKQLLHALGIKVTQVHAAHHAGGIGVGESSLLLTRVVLPYFDARIREITRAVIYLKEDDFSSTRALFQALTQEQILCLALEGSNGKNHLRLSFLGGHKQFATGGVNLTKLSGAPLLPIYCTRAGNKDFLLEFGAPIELPKESSREQIVAAALTHQTQALEARIREKPAWYRDWSLLGE